MIYKLFYLGPYGDILRDSYITPFLSQRRKVAKLFMLIASWGLCEKYLLTI